MSVIYLSGDALPTDNAECSICRKYLPLSHLSAGMCDLQDNQMFFCDAHYIDQRGLILGWADYMAAERQRQLYTLGIFEEAYDG
jgi:hypothetical protein